MQQKTQITRHNQIKKLRKNAKTLLLLALAILLLSACDIAAIAEDQTPPKMAEKASSEEAQAAVDTFWNTFHSGDFENWDQANFDLVAAYLDNQNDPELARLVGFSHMWRLSERGRLSEDDPRITNSALLAEVYFDDALRLDPTDARVKGFLSAAMFAAGSIQNDDKKQVRAYFQLLDAIKEWPEFNYFTAGYVFSSMNPKGSRYQEALEYQWKNIDVCFAKSFNRDSLDTQFILDFYKTNPADSMPEKKKRACYNSWIAPHNLEGFFMNFGDMQLKNGNKTIAKQAYDLTKSLPDFATWPQKDKLELRLSTLDERAAAYASLPTNGRGYNELDDQYLMFESTYACMGCHQERSISPAQ